MYILKIWIQEAWFPAVIWIYGEKYIASPTWSLFIPGDQMKKSKMAKGHRGKTQTDTPNGQEKAKNNKAASKESSTNTQNLQMGKGLYRNHDKLMLFNKEQFREE